MSHPVLLSAVLERRLDALREHLPGALDGDVDGVHQARVASRRLREALPILRPLDGHGRVRRAERGIRAVTRHLGPVRELDVALGHLDEHAAGHPGEDAGIARVRGWVERQRAERREQLLAALDEAGLERLWRRLEPVAVLVAERGADGEPEWRRLLAGRIRDRARRLSMDIERAGVLYAGEALHAVRIATKKLRYALELAGELKLATVAAALRSLKRQQDLLGSVHDLEVLGTFADRAAAEAGGRVTSGRLVGEWVTECRELHGRYLRARPLLLRVTDAAADTVSARVAGTTVAPARSARRAKTRTDR